ncbi:type IV secretory system conjugative DNA transfer family protein [Phenylobacterium sp. LH3H17]|uniref:type IV secretory system conjugative DNA transfer family protein n=1 Tax=Phenylobacterium sp. LH3H17 TaxID=2903901 RepID=UPI0020C9B60A|nr:type IV secretory system conjugative DNA transfer family protein [Phenylobacterium sp. LH3H17]UTP40929.1 type IV secretory system conjugative DNA transfer family protein [Phenylobacterium sp. LH3H17]
MSRTLDLMKSLAGGFFAGVLLGTGCVIAVDVSDAVVDETLRTILPNATGWLGAVVGFGGWWARGETRPSDVHGSARFGQEAASTLTDPNGLIVARSSQGRLMRYGGPAHLLTIAPTRSGKGVGAIIPNLLTANRSVICIDPKGENTRAAFRARAAFGPVHVLDPFGLTARRSAAFNPLAHLDPWSQDLAEDAALIAETLVYDPPGQVGEAHWNEEAKALIAGLILHVVATEPPASRSLAKVREILTTAPKDFEARLEAMQTSGAAGGLVARAANRHLGKSDREATGVLSSAQRHTHFLDSPRMVSVLGRSDFGFADLKARATTIFLVLPPDRLATHARWLRLMVGQAINALARQPTPQAATPVLFLLDEFAALGRLEAIERGFGLMAGYGLQLWAILQDIHQLRSLYGQSAGTFLSNAGLIQIFNVADIDTASWVSRTLGTATESYETTSTSVSTSPTQPGSTHGSSTSPHHVARPLMTPDEVMRVNHDRLLLLRPGQEPLAPWKVRYYRDPEFQGLFDA